MTTRLAKLLKPRERKNSSPFSSPYSNLRASPVAARRSSLEERRRPAAKYDSDISPDRIERIEEDESQDDEEEPEETINEDDHGELSPLLPIFSAEQLGRRCWLRRALSLTQR